MPQRYVHATTASLGLIVAIENAQRLQWPRYMQHHDWQMRLQSLSSCSQAWTGPACDQRTCPEDCNHNGVCHEATGKCRCKAGFAGKACEIKFAQINAVTMVFVQTVCAFFDGWRGLNCSISMKAKAAPKAIVDKFTTEECVDKCVDKCMTKCASDKDAKTTECVSKCHNPCVSSCTKRKSKENVLASESKTADK